MHEFSYLRLQEISMKGKSKSNRRSSLGIRNRIARIHLYLMLEQAFNSAVSCDNALAEKFGYKAREFAKRFGIRIPKRWKLFYCKHCKSFIFPGKTARIRLRTHREPHIVIYCYKCGEYTRIPIKRKSIEDEIISRGRIKN